VLEWILGDHRAGQAQAGGALRLLDPGVRDQADPGEDLIRLDHDLVGAVDPLDPRRTISERRIDAGLPQIGRFEQ
jgi:hypothetical protein